MNERKPQQQAQPRSHKRRKVGGLLALGAIALVVALTSCGSDSEKPLTADEFRTQANAIFCGGETEIHEAVSAVFGGGEPTPQVLQTALDTIVSSSNRQADEIDALAAPGSIESEVAELLAELRSATKVAEGQGLDFFETGGDPWATATELAVKLGLDVCAAS